MSPSLRTLHRSPLELGPRPLLFSRHDVVLSWSPKSACSQALLWFLVQEGLLGKANAHDPWPHKFRNQVYYQMPRYKNRRADFEAAGGKGYTLVRVTRDPARRLVSCFRQALRFNLIDQLARQKLGRTPADGGLSLEDFHDVLKSETLLSGGAVDVHVCAQEHPLWHSRFDRVITINVDETGLYGALNAVEQALGMRHTDFAAQPKFGRLASHHHARDSAHEDAGPIEAFRFTRAAVRSGQFPKSALNAAPRLPGIARALHGRDFGQVATGDTAGVLFS